MNLTLTLPPSHECFSKKYCVDLKSTHKTYSKEILSIFTDLDLESFSKHIPESVKVYIPHILLNTLQNNSNVTPEEDTLSQLLNWVQNKEHLLDLLNWYAELIPLQLIFEKVVPYIEHFPDKSNGLLLKLSKTHLEDTVLFVANLSIAQYKYADDLLDWLENSLKNEYDETKFQSVQEVFEKHRADIDEIRKNRMLLFPKIVD